MERTRQIERDARQLLRLCLVSGVLEEGGARQIVQQVIQSKRRDYLALLSEFHRLVRLECEKHTAQVQSAVPLSSNLRSDIRARLENVYGTKINIEFESNPELIGGVRIKIGSDVYDGTVRSSLAELEKQF
ncbi:MAG TPA: F0F1 ATP synthase subunit delta [Candidatus Solibacter sp.]|nr:F0F1 ATP synthase subunit delta [Candidatus Solibacter sp.]